MQTETELQKKFETCIDVCADSLFRVAFRLTGNETLARELVQETYLNAWRGLSSLSDTNKMRGWMFAILRNQYSKLIRVESRSVTTSDQLTQLPGPTQLPGKMERPTEHSELVQEGLANLDEKFKLPLLLVAMEQLSIDEAAAALELPRGTVLSRLHRGRQKLKEYLIRVHGDFAATNQEGDIDGI